VLGLVRKSTVERLLRETLQERERVVQLLVEQVEYLRAQLGMATVTVSRAAAGQPPALTAFPDDVTFEQGGVVSEEEEHLHSMLQAKVISQVEFDQGMERLKGRFSSDIIE
jgi:hypothetical protein